MYNTIFLTLGIDCNFKCRYCLQTDNLTTRIQVKKMSSKVRKFIVDNTQKLQMKYGGTAKTHLRLWGGEPLLYWETIKEIVDDLGSDYCTFSMMSNGKLLTKEKVNYLNDNNIAFTLSHDGKNTISTRLEDVLEDDDFINLFTSLRAYGISAVMSAFNSDYYEIWDYFDNKFAPYGIKVPIHVDLIMDTWGMSSDLLDINVDQYSAMLDTFMDRAYEYMAKGETDNREYVVLQPSIDRVKNLVKLKNEEGFKHLTFPKCGANQAVANIDLEGNFYICHNSSKKLGTVEDSYTVLLNKFKPYNKYSTSEKCLACPYIYLCTGGCFLIQEGGAHERYCELQKLFYSKVFELLLRFQ